MINIRKISRLIFIRKTQNQFSINQRVVKRARALYECECGQTKEIDIQNVKSGHTISCGCYLLEISRNRATHRMTHHPLYGVWGGIKRRCYNPNSADWPLYGERGVKMCDEWKNNFMSFYNWCIENGWKKGLYIDKEVKTKELGIPALLYSPQTCMFITPKESSNNVRTNRILEYKAVKKNLNQWANDMNINRGTLKTRLEMGWSIEDALTKPIRDINAPRK